MKKTILLLFMCTLQLLVFSQPSKAAFVSTFESLTALQSNGDDDEIAAANWFINTYGGVFIPVSQIKNGSVDLSTFKVLWIHFDRQSDETTINNEFAVSFLDNNIKNAINNFYKAGGNLLLSIYATRYVTDLGRYNLPIELKGFGSGGNNGDVWYASPTWGTFNGAPEVSNKITDPIYNGLTGITNINRDNGSSYSIIPLIGVGWKEDHNYFWNPQPDKNNDDVWKYRDFESVWSTNSLATWAHVQDYFGTAITRWLPQGDFQGKAITIGIGSYEWNQNSETNPFQSNIVRLTKNALDELSPAGISTAKTNVTNEKIRLIIHNNSLEFENLNENSTARIFTVNGKLISKSELNRNSLIIETTNLPKGIYVVGIGNKNNINQFKFIK